MNSGSPQYQFTFENGPLDYVRMKTHRCIIVDGDPGAGKTCLAQIIGQKTGAKIKSLDEYLMENGAPYLDQLKYDLLAKEIQETDRVIIEGVCVLGAIERLNVKHDHHIFLQSMKGFGGNWEFEEYLRPNVDLPKSTLRREVVLYYRERKPHEICDKIGWQAE